MRNNPCFSLQLYWNLHFLLLVTSAAVLICTNMWFLKNIFISYYIYLKQFLILIIWPFFCNSYIHRDKMLFSYYIWCLWLTLMFDISSDWRKFIWFLQSSLAAARADNFYYPPEWEPKKVCLCQIFMGMIFVASYFYFWAAHTALLFRVGWTNSMDNMLWGRGQEK